MSIMCHPCGLKEVNSFSVNGGYGPWGEFGECTVTCGGGSKQRERKCDNPEPMFGGKTCEQQELGSNVETESCNEVPCPSKCWFISTMPSVLALRASC